jgi:hypothetical protein
MFAQLATLSTFHPNLPASVLAVLAVGLASHWTPDAVVKWVKDGFVRLPGPAQGLALFAAALALRQMGEARAVPFVYFQF